MEKNMESPNTALEHIRFQLDLLRLTATPLKLSGMPAEALRPQESAAESPESQNELELEKAMAELTSTASRLQDYRR
jgi:hypothetical protein